MITARASNPIPYVNRTWASLIEATIGKLSELNPEWTNHEETDLGITLIEVMAYYTDINNFYIDKMVNESYVSTAQQRRSLLKLADFRNWTPPNYEPSRTTVKFELSSPLGVVVEIPAFTGLSSGSIEFYTLFPAWLPAGSTEVDVEVVQGVRFRYLLDATGVNKYKIPDTQVSSSPDLVQVIVNNEDWVYVQSFNDSSSKDKHFTIEIDEDNYVYIIFGDGLYGKLPVNSVLEVFYNKNDGREGIVSSDSITVVTGEILDENNDTVVPSLSNVDPSSGGNDPLSENYLRYMLKGLGKIQDRALTKEDFEIVVMKSGVVRQVKVYDVRDDREIGYYMIHIYILVDELNDSLHKTLEDLIDEYKYTTCQYTILKVTEVLVDIECKISLLPGFSFASVKAGLLEIFNKFFKHEEYKSGEGLMIGDGIHYSDIFGAIENTKGVDYATLYINSDVNIDIGAGLGEIVTLGSVTIEKI